MRARVCRPSRPFPAYFYSRKCTSYLTLFSLSSSLSSSLSVFCFQSTTASFKEQCGLPTVAKLKQCIESLATRLQSPEGTLGATMVLKEGYPCLEPLVNPSEPTRKLLTAYNTVSRTFLAYQSSLMSTDLRRSSSFLMFLKFCKCKCIYSCFVSNTRKCVCALSYIHVHQKRAPPFHWVTCLFFKNKKRHCRLF